MEESTPDLVRYLTTQSWVERDALFLKLLAARIRDPKQVVMLWEIPNTVATTLEDISKRMLERDVHDNEEFHKNRDKP